MNRPPVTDSAVSMPYRVLRPALRPGDVLLCCGTSLMSRAIRLFGRSRWSHVAMVDRLRGRVIVYESTFPRGRMLPLSQWLKEDHGEVYVGLPSCVDAGGWLASPDMACEYALSVHFRPYGLLDLVRYAVWRLTGWWPGRADNAEQLVCSELVGRALRHGGMRVPQGGPLISPEDVASVVDVVWALRRSSRNR